MSANISNTNQLQKADGLSPQSSMTNAFGEMFEWLMLTWVTRPGTGPRSTHWWCRKLAHWVESSAFPNLSYRCQNLKKTLIIINQRNKPGGMHQSLVVIHRDIGPNNYNLISAGRDELTVAHVDLLAVRALVHY
jgi:hypothetical protein